MLQIGSPKGVARLLQRAGRSGHAPGRASRVTLVPTNTLELVEAAAARSARATCRRAHRVARARPTPLDVLVQHLVTIALGGGFVEDELLDEVRDTPRATARCSDAEWDWALDFVGRGGESCARIPTTTASPRRGRRWIACRTRAIAQRHRMSVGTIVSDASMLVQLRQRRRGSARSRRAFIARLRKGDASCSPAARSSSCACRR